MFFGISGNIRSGKTLIMTLILYLMHLRGYPIYTNYRTTFSKYISPLDLINFNIGRGCLGLDEIHTMIDSRMNSQAGRYITYFMTQSGKRDVHIFYTTQAFMMVEKRLRELTHIRVLCQRNMIGFVYRMYKLDENGTDYTYMRTITMPFKRAKPLFPLYDTKEIVYAPDVSSENIMSWEQLMEVYSEAPTKQGFKILLRKMDPYLSLDTAGAIFDYIKADMPDKARKLMGLKSPIIEV